MVKRSRESSPSPPPEDSPSTSRPSTPHIGTPHDLDEPAPRIVKYTQLDDEETVPETAEVMRCSLPPHPETIAFASYEEYEIHYAKAHVNRCAECRKNFPTEHFLDLHIQENHDSLNEARKARGEKTYACYVEACDRKCSSHEKRKRHLIDKHMFPKDYDFDVINEGIDRRTSLLRSHRHRRRSSAATAGISGGQRARRRSATAGSLQDQAPSNSEPAESVDTLPETEESTAGNSVSDIPESPVQAGSAQKTIEDKEMTDLATTMSSLRFVPPSIRFGRGKRGGFSER
ncbi:MAG: hypothetical protein M4579_001798 [Chaenotheca gracillima]|nr:MAG: hypothetical protein M4579_001798 [Chaenotheca gracillima]